MGLIIKYDRSEFIRRANVKHDNKYDYSLTDYKNSRDKIKIICPIHGVFEQMPYNHLQGKGCHFCSRNQKSNYENFSKQANIVHNFKYEYPDKNYTNSVTKINILCKNHGLFSQTPGNHLNGVGCPKCSGNKRLTIQEFIKAANIKHNNLYYYPDLNYKRYDDEIEIGCYRHGVFKQIVRNHLSGRGCQTCRNSKGELLIKQILDVNNIRYKQQYKFNDLKHKDLLKFDFAVIDDVENVKYLIEFNGEQHYKFKTKFHKSQDNFITNQYRDSLKIDYCLKHGIILYIIKFNDDINSKMSNILKNHQ
jgi:hypothetical protein